MSPSLNKMNKDEGEFSLTLSDLLKNASRLKQVLECLRPPVIHQWRMSKLWRTSKMRMGDQQRMKTITSMASIGTTWDNKHISLLLV